MCVLWPEGGNRPGGYLTHSQSGASACASSPDCIRVNLTASRQTPACAGLLTLGHSRADLPLTAALLLPRRFLGLTVGLIQADLQPAERQQAYRCDITYVTNSELGFDFLRDNLAAVCGVSVYVLKEAGGEEGGRQVLRGLCV